jgi:hypothetical protein
MVRQTVDRELSEQKYTLKIKQHNNLTCMFYLANHKAHTQQDTRHYERNCQKLKKFLQLSQRLASHL